MATALHVVIPGLLGPWLQNSIPGPAQAELRTLARLCSRAAVVRTAERDFAATLCKRFALTAAQSRDLPLAALTYLGDGGVRDDSSFFLRADPVHLRAGLRQVLLFDARTLELSTDEADSLSADFNKTFAGDGLALEVLHTSRWYLRLPQPAHIATYALFEVIGKDISRYLPYGAAGAYWNKLVTEIQMLFYHSEVNTQRQAANALPVNSLWFWGGGALPSAVQCGFDAIYADDILCRGLARCAGAAVSAVPADAADWRDAAAQDTNGLLVLTQSCFDALDNEPERWLEHLRCLQNDWLEGLLDALNEKALHQLYIYPCDGRIFRLDRSSLRRFWRRITPLSQHLLPA